MKRTKEHARMEQRSFTFYLGHVDNFQLNESAGTLDLDISIPCVSLMSVRKAISALGLEPTNEYLLHDAIERASISIDGLAVFKILTTPSDPITRA